ncbi:hypothetical protein ACFY71_08300 [Streptomyces cinerochromogenes]
MRLPDTEEEHLVLMWVWTPRLWEDLLVQHGLILESVTAIGTPRT